MSRFNIHHVNQVTYDEPCKRQRNQVILYPIQDEYRKPLARNCR